MNWYIESVRTDKSYLDKVHSTVEEVMDWFCDEVSNINEEEFDEEKIVSLCKDIFDTLPILRFVKKYWLNISIIWCLYGLFVIASADVSWRPEFKKDGWYKIYDLYAGTFPPQFEAKEDWIETYEEFSNRRHSKI